ncbi:MAG: hypothetical protein K8I60_10770, partial [Anaerolineae bacterium]|nr:hypothetical protein [Anaerolineae bacterium]
IPFRAETRTRIIDGTLYVDLDTAQDMIGAEYSGWGSYPLDVSAEALDTSSSKPLVTGLDAGNLIGAFEPAFVRQFLTVTRTDDDKGNAVFETYVDIPGLYAQPVFRELMRERLQAQRAMMNMPSGAVTDNQLDNLARWIGEAYPEPLLLHTQSVDLETGFLSALSLWMLDEASMMIESAANNNDITSWSQSSVNFSLALDNFNEPVEITIPENVTALDYETITLLPVGGFLPISQPDR